jgi:hypothetical protein
MLYFALCSITREKAVQANGEEAKEEEGPVQIVYSNSQYDIFENENKEITTKENDFNSCRYKYKPFKENKYYEKNEDEIFNINEDSRLLVLQGLDIDDKEKLVKEEAKMQETLNNKDLNNNGKKPKYNSVKKKKNKKRQK